MASSDMTSSNILPSQITAIILAGGQSTRMGRDKALIEIDGIPLLTHIYNIAESICHRVLIVTDKPSQYQSLYLGQHAIVAKDRPEICKFVKDDFSEGPLVGFVQGLFEVHTSWVLLLACDLPRLDIETVKDWRSQLSKLPKTAVAYLPKREQGWEPLCGFYRASCLEKLEDFTLEGGRSFQKWLEHENVVALDCHSTDILFNCNTPEDLAQIQHLDPSA
jgi:molybdenum cofactor guanylyltransferase